MSFQIKKFHNESKWKKAIFAKLDCIEGESIVVPGGKTPLFLYKDYFSMKLCKTLILSDERITKDISASNYNLIKSYSKTKVISLRNPKHIRPWQHVLDVCYGYLLIPIFHYKNNHPRRTEL